MRLTEVILKEDLKRTILDMTVDRRISRGEDRKIQIMEAAIKLYADLGVDYVTFQDVARRAKTSRPVVLHHFATARELFVATMKLIRVRFQMMAIEKIESAGDCEEKMIRYIESCFTWLEQHREDVKAWFLFFYMCASDRSLRQLHHELTSIGHQRIVALIKLGEGDGVFKKTGQIEIRAKTIQRLITGALNELLTEWEPSQINEVRKQTVEQCLNLLR